MKWRLAIMTLTSHKVSAFKTAWARVVSAIRTEIPGIYVDFSPARAYVGFNAGRDYSAGVCGSGGCDLAAFVPVSTSYDTLSLSVHDGLPHTVDQATWEFAYLDPPASERRIGLTELLAVAVANDKKVALSEWAPVMADEGCGGVWIKSPDPALFIQKVFDWLDANKSFVAFDTYFSPSCTSLYNRQATDAAITYKACWDDGTC
jgi:hypothetical protein